MNREIELKKQEGDPQTQCVPIALSETLPSLLASWTSGEFAVSLRFKRKRTMTATIFLTLRVD